jgi:hypothetical protein
MPQHDYDLSFPAFGRWKRLAIVWGVVVVVGLIVVSLTWNTFFKYVPPGKHLVIVSKNGAPLDEGEVLANEGQKGIQRAVRGEGWHFVMPILYTTEVEENTFVPAGKVGIVTALGGKTPKEGRVLAEDGERGIQHRVLPPGVYRINKRGYEVTLVDATEIKPGFVGVRRRLLGTPAAGLFAREDSEEQGYLTNVLQPGLYYINTKEFEVIKAEIGIVQTTFFARTEQNPKDKAITFTSKGGFPISIDCTVEWEVLSEHMPALVAEYGTWHEVEKKVIDVQAHAIGRDKGIDYGIQDFLEGRTREKFQEDFSEELIRVCKEKNVTVHSAFIRRIVIPDEYLKPIRDKQIAIETQITTRAKELTAETENQVEREQRMIQQQIAKVEAETKQVTGQIDQQVKNLGVLTEAQIERMKADYGKKIASLDADRTKLMGQAEAESKKLKETAKSSINQMKMEVFQNDASAFLRYTLAEQLNPNMVLRLFHSGAGTFWTNMDNKSMSLMLPAAVAPAPAKEKPASFDK